MRGKSDSAIEESILKFVSQTRNNFDLEHGHEGCFDQPDYDGNTVFCEYSIPIWERSPIPELFRFDEDASNLFYIPLTLKPHTTASFTKARSLINKIKVGEFKDIGELEELSLWSTIGSSELMLKLRASKITFDQVVKILGTLSLGVPMYRDNCVEPLDIANEMVIRNGKSELLRIPNITVNQDEMSRAVKAFIEIQGIREMAVFENLVHILSAFDSVVIGIGFALSVNHMMVELFIPCGHFGKLCELTKRLDEIKGDFLKQTFIGYHPDDVAN